MSDNSPEPTELIYAPGDSWAPLLVAAGVAVTLVAVWSHWWWALIGLAILIAGLRSWWRQSNDEIARMRREQKRATAVLPAEPVRRLQR